MQYIVSTMYDPIRSSTVVHLQWLHCVNADAQYYTKKISKVDQHCIEIAVNCTEYCGLTCGDIRL